MTEGERQAFERQYGAIIHSDRAAVDVGLNALKLVTLISAGSIVALLAFVGQLWEKDRVTALSVLSAAEAFAWAVVLALLCAFAAYFYQSCVTADEWVRLYKLAKSSEIPRRIRIGSALMPWFGLLMLGAGFASFGFVVDGVLNVSDRLLHANLPHVSASVPPVKN